MKNEDKTKNELSRELLELQQEVASLKTSLDRCNLLRESLEFNLGERMKELRCQNFISTIIANQALSADETFQQIAETIPPAWQFPENTGVSIELGSKVFITPLFSASSPKLSMDIVADGNIAGKIEVCYTGNHDEKSGSVFLPEESELLLSISQRLGNLVEKKEKEATLSKSGEKYRALFEDSPIGYLIFCDGLFIECNREVEKLLRGDRKSILNKSPEFLSPEFQPNGKKSAEYVEEVVAKAFDQGTFSFEWMHKRFDGTEFLALVRLSVVLYEGKPSLFITWQDITQFRKAEEGVRKLSQAVEQCPVSIVITDRDGNIEYANPKACETTGYTLEELKGNNPRVLKSGETRTEEYTRLWDRITKGGEWKGIFHNKRKNGELYWESSTIAPIMDAAGNITHYVAVKEDITERRKMELALQKSQDRLSQVMEDSQTLIWETDATGLYTHVSPVVAQVLGFQPEEIIQKMRIFDPIPDGYREQALELFEKRETVHKLTFPAFTPQKNLIWLEINGAPVYDEDHNFSGYRGGINDITARKLAEDELLKFRTISDMANYGIAITDLDGTITYINECFARMHDREINDLVGNNLSMLHNQDQLGHVAELLEYLKEDGEFHAMEVWRTRKDGSVFPSLMNAMIILENGKPQFMSATAIDITELKKSEDALRRSEEKLNYAQEIARMGSWELEMKSGELKWSVNYFGLVERDPGEFNPDYQWFLQLVYPDDRQLIEGAFERIMETKLADTIEMRLVMPDGRIKWVQNIIVPEFHEEVLVRLSGVNIDITEKKLDEEKIRIQNARMNAIIEAMPDMIFINDCDGNYLEVISARTSELPYPREKFTNAGVRDIFDKPTAELHVRKIKECLEHKKLITYEYSGFKDGRPAVNESRVAYLMENRVLRFVRDITERKQQEREIRQLNMAIEQSPVSIVITDLVARIQYVSPAFFNITGYTAGEVIGKHAGLLKSGLTEREVYNDLWANIQSGKPWQGEWINKKKDGSLYWEKISITPIQDENGVLSNYLAIKEDITGRKKAEQEILELNASLELKVSERTAELAKTNANLSKEIEERKQVEIELMVKTTELEKFFTVALDLLCIADTSGHFIKLNQSWQTILGYSLPDLENSRFLDFVHPDDLQRTIEVLGELSEQKPVLDFVNRYRTKEGTYKFIEWHSVPVGEMIYAAARDITGRKRAEEFEFEMLQLSTELTGTTFPEIDPAINMALIRIGRFLGADRAYIFEFDHLAATMSNTFEWCNEGITSEKDNMQNVPTAHIPMWMESLNNHENIIIPSVGEMPETWKAEREILEPQGIRSLLVIPMIAGNVLIGFAGLDSVVREKEYTLDEINVLKVWGSMIASLINKKRSESLLEQTRQNYETFFNTIDDFLWVMDSEKRIIHTNNTAFDRLEFSREELINQPVVLVHPEDRREEAERTIDEMLAGKTDFCQIPVLTKSGNQIPVETKVKFGHWNGLPVVFGVSKDISKIQLSERKFSTAFHSNSVMMTISDFNDGKYIDINDEFIETIGYSREELIGKSNRELGLFIDPSSGNAKLEHLKMHIPVRKHEIQMLSKDGSVKTGLLSMDSIYIGQHHCLLAATVDITERKKAEEEIWKARMEAEQANQAKSEFLSRMSHELRTPLNSILGFAQLLEMSELDARQRKEVSHINRSGKHLLELINEVLDISRIESGRIELSLEPVRIYDVVCEMMDIVNPTALARQINVEMTDTPLVYSFILSDRQRVKQVLLNLINNAVKYNRTGGSVWITADAMPVNDRGQVPVRISVRDNGNGIAAEDLPRLFMPFERIGADKLQTEGTGLGLAVVKKLMDAMGGKLGVESALGEGSTFWIEFPQVESQAESLRRGSLPGELKISDDRRKGTILYIEDNMPNIELVQEIIDGSRPGVLLITSLYGKQAVDLAVEYKPDLVLLDLDLPDINGSEVLRQLKGEEKTRDIPVVILSADAMSSNINRLMQSGAADYVVKPLEIKTFLGVVDKYIATITE